MMLQRTISLGNAVLLVVSLPMFSLTVSTAIHHKAASGASQELKTTSTPFGRETIAADLAARNGVLLALILGRH